MNENRLDGLWNAVAADAIRSVARHQPDEDRANDRHENHERSEVVLRRRGERETEPLEKEKICEEVDELQQPGGNVRGEHSDDNRQTGDWKHPCGCCEVTEMVECLSD